MANLKILNIKPKIPEKLDGLWRLAYNYYWTWSPDISSLFQRIDMQGWENSGHNPVKLLSSVSEVRLEELVENRGFMEHYHRALVELDAYLMQQTWYGEKVLPGHSQLTIAYFCAEYGFHESLQIYSGGLGVLSGDHLKSASDLGIPLVGVGLLYRFGYFKQVLDSDGWQREEYPAAQFELLPISPVVTPEGEELRVSVEMAGRKTHAKVWNVEVGRIKLLLLDTDIPENTPEDRLITDQLYGGDNEHRIRQEIVLGIGGMRALEALNLKPTVYHMNEGHAAFLAIERIRNMMDEYGMTFAEAQVSSSINNVFTTHTPVPAGHDSFTPEKASKYMEPYARQMGIGVNEILRLGRAAPDNPAEKFSMTILAIRSSNYINGVSKLHGKISRRMWRFLFGELPDVETPIDSITNGVHPQSFIAPEMKMLLDRHLGSEWRERPADPKVWERVSTISHERLWSAKERARESLVIYVREKVAQQLERRGISNAKIARIRNILDRDALTIGFARRFATYKRAGLLFSDIERLKKILNNSDYPVQIIFAGKAHPADEGGKAIIRQIIKWADDEELRNRIAFIENYDLSVAKHMVQGVDVWLNTPIHGQEASGTSGMKILYNGGLHLSILDGWWNEGFCPNCGWAIKTVMGDVDPDYRNSQEANSLYNLLENELVPLFYKREADELPVQWIDMMKNSMSKLCPAFSTHRMLEDYLNKGYIPASDRWLDKSGEGVEAFKEFAKGAVGVRAAWDRVAFEEAKLEAAPGELVSGMEVEASCRLYINGIAPEYMKVELFMASLGPEEEIIDMTVFPLEPTMEKTRERCSYKTKANIPWAGKIGLAIRVMPDFGPWLKRLELEMSKWAKL